MSHATPNPLVAFDLDETLGVPIIDNDSITGFRLRDGCRELLGQLRQSYTLCLWTVSSRVYLNKALSFGLGEFFTQTYSWDELAVTWKDVRKIGVAYLIDDSPHHRARAVLHGLETRYIVVAAYGSREDFADPLLWTRQIRQVLMSSKPII